MEDPSSSLDEGAAFRQLFHGLGAASVQSAPTERSAVCQVCRCAPSARGRVSTFLRLGSIEVGKLDGLQKRIPATVVRFPFYDPEKTRPRGQASA